MKLPFPNINKVICHTGCPCPGTGRACRSSCEERPRLLHAGHGLLQLPHCRARPGLSATLVTCLSRCIRGKTWHTGREESWGAAPQAPRPEEVVRRCSRPDTLAACGGSVLEQAGISWRTWGGPTLEQGENVRKKNQQRGAIRDWPPALSLDPCDLCCRGRNERVTLTWEEGRGEKGGF